MAGNHFTGVAEEVSTGTGGAKTHLELIAAANHGIMLSHVSVTFQGTTVTQEPYIVNITRVTTTGTGTAITLVKDLEGWPDNILTTGKKNFTVEPTLGDVLRSLVIHPQGGWEHVIQFDSPVFVKGGSGVAIVITSATAVDATSYINAEE